MAELEFGVGCNSRNRRKIPAPPSQHEFSVKPTRSVAERPRPRDRRVELLRLSPEEYGGVLQNNLPADSVSRAREADRKVLKPVPPPNPESGGKAQAEPPAACAQRVRMLLFAIATKYLKMPQFHSDTFIAIGLIVKMSWTY